MGDTGTARRYEPSPRVRAQLETLPTLGSPEFWARVGVRDQQNRLWLAAEVLVYALRCFLLRGDVDGAQRLGLVIVERWGKFVLRQAWCWFPDSEAYREEFREEVHTHLWERVFDPAKTFWEANFIHALLGVCFDVVKELMKRKEHESPLTVDRDDEGEPLDELPDVADPDPQDFDARLLTDEGNGRLVAALAQLPPPIRRAIFLRHIKDWPEASSDPSAMTISRALGVTDRTVRNYLRRGEATLRAWYEKERADGRA